MMSKQTCCRWRCCFHSLRCCRCYCFYCEERDGQYHKGQDINQLTISRPWNLGSRRAETYHVSTIIAIHSVGRVDREPLEPGIASIGSVDGGSTFLCQNGGAEAGGVGSAHAGPVCPGWFRTVDFDDGGRRGWRGRRGRGHGSFGRTNQGDDLCHSERPNGQRRKWASKQMGENLVSASVLLFPLSVYVSFGTNEQADWAEAD